MPTEEEHRLAWIRGQLDAALRCLTWSAEEQVAWLTSQDLPLGNADELALEYGDMSMLVVQLPEVSEDTRASLSELDQLLDRMSGPANASRWTLDALRNDPGWDEVRRLATEAVTSWDADWS